MKYLTLDKFIRLQASGAKVMDAADADWEKAVADYEQHLETIRPDLPPSIRHLLDDMNLHDAEVFLMGRQGSNFIIALRLETPPRDFRILTYCLLDPPTIAPTDWPREHTRAHWLFDEIDLVRNGEPSFTHA